MRFKYTCGLFGSSDSKSSTTSTTDTGPWRAQAPYLRHGFSEAQDLYNAGQTPYFGFNPVASTSPYQQQGWEQAAQAANNLSPQIGNYMGAFGLATSPELLHQSSNPYLNDAINASSRDAIQQYQREVLPGIRSNSIGLGHGFGSTRTGVAEGIAGEGLLNTIGDISAGMRYNNYNSQLDRITNSAQYLPGLVSSAFAPSAALRDIGQEQRGIEQEGIDADIAEWTYGKEEPWERLSRYLQATSGAWGSYGTNKTTSEAEAPGFFG